MIPVVGFALLQLASVAWADEPATGADVPARASHGSGGKLGVFPAATIKVGDKDREFRLIAPKNAFANGPAPLVFAFHGLLDSKDLMSLYTQLDRLAVRKGFVLVYPNGLNRHWPLIPGLDRDDQKFFETLYDAITAKYDIDLNRVYLTGMSNGAFFTHLVARAHSDKIAAIAPHSGGLGALAGNPLNLKHKYAVLVIHGDEDGIVKVEEGRKTRDYYQKWGHPIEYLEVPGLNHFWAHKIGVNEKMWTFFVEHPLQP